MLLDANIIIYLGDVSRGPLIQRAILNENLYTCNIVIAEVLGFGAIDEEDELFAKRLFKASENLPFDEAVTEKVVAIRKRHRIPLPDAIIAATALVHDLPLVTTNTKDFRSIEGIKLLDPLAV